MATRGPGRRLLRFLTVEHVLLVTGAGASRELGGDQNPLPLMGEWASDIVDRLERETPWGLAAILGLERNTVGEVFEHRLGRFLAWERALTTVAELSDLGEDVAAGGRPKVFEKWLNQARRSAGVVNKVVFESLFANFGQSRVSSFAAGKAYNILLNLLGVTRGNTALTVATTNYDFAIEDAMSGLGWFPEWGQEPSTSTTGASPPIRIANLSQATEMGRTPVLHLHGRVGWYLKDDGRLLSFSPDVVYNKDFGVPGLLLPEPDKRYEEDLHFRVMWEEFRKAIERAARILVLGHSLNDDGLREALAPVAANRVRVTMCVDSDEGTEPYEKEKSRILSLLPALPPGALIRMRFGPEFVPDGTVKHVFETWRG